MRTLYEAIGPTDSVMGIKRALGPGIEVAHVMLNPLGAQMTGLCSGFQPFARAWGHHLRNQTNAAGSPWAPIVAELR